jgi:hypothetical protein
MKSFSGDSKGGGFSKKPPLAAGGIEIIYLALYSLKTIDFFSISCNHRTWSRKREKS